MTKKSRALLYLHCVFQVSRENVMDKMRKLDSIADSKCGYYPKSSTSDLRYAQLPPSTCSGPELHLIQSPLASDCALRTVWCADFLSLPRDTLHRTRKGKLCLQPVCYQVFLVGYNKLCANLLVVGLFGYSGYLSRLFYLPTSRQPRQSTSCTIIQWQKKVQSCE